MVIAIDERYIRSSVNRIYYVINGWYLLTNNESVINKSSLVEKSPSITLKPSSKLLEIILSILTFYIGRIEVVDSNPQIHNTFQ